jgi:elongation factor G
MVEEVKEYRDILIEAVADYDENLLDKYMEDPDSITEDEINTALLEQLLLTWLSFL